MLTALIQKQHINNDMTHDYVMALTYYSKTPYVIYSKCLATGLWKGVNQLNYTESIQQSFKAHPFTWVGFCEMVHKLNFTNYCYCPGSLKTLMGLFTLSKTEHHKKKSPPTYLFSLGAHTWLC